MRGIYRPTVDSMSKADLRLIISVHPVRLEKWTLGVGLDSNMLSISSMIYTSVDFVFNLPIDYV